MKSPAMPSPSTLIARVLASPGAPSTNRWPSANSAMRRRLISRFLADYLPAEMLFEIF